MLLAALVLAVTPSATDMNSGAFLYRSCTNLVRLWDGAKGFDLGRAADCKSYILGFLDGNGFAVAQDTAAGTGGSGHWLYCLDGAPSEKTAVRVYMNWMDKHPRAFPDPRSVGLVGALMDAYPCPVKK